MLQLTGCTGVPNIIAHNHIRGTLFDVIRKAGEICKRWSDKESDICRCLGRQPFRDSGSRGKDFRFLCRNTYRLQLGGQGGARYGSGVGDEEVRNALRRATLQPSRLRRQ